MSTSSTESLPMISMGENCQRVVIFNLQLKREQALSQKFTNSDVIVGLVFEHKRIEPVVVQ